MCIRSAGAEKSVVIKKRPVSLESSSGNVPQSQAGGGVIFWKCSSVSAHRRKLCPEGAEAAAEAGSWIK